MGRKKIYTTEEELIQNRREYVRKYYNKNKEKIDAKARANYYKRKGRKSLQDNIAKG